MVDHHYISQTSTLQVTSIHESLCFAITLYILIYFLLWLYICMNQQQLRFLYTTTDNFRQK